MINPNGKTKVLITGKLHDVAIQLLSHPPKELALSRPLDICYLPDAPRSLILKEIVDSHVLISRSETDIDSELLLAGKNLRILARAAVGYGNIDCDLATELGILVVNTPGQNTNSAAELTLGLLLSLMRKIPAAHASTSQGGWNRHYFSGSELGGKTLGLVGLGNVGHRVAKFARGFDMHVIAFDPYLASDIFRKNHVERKDTLEDLLVQSNVISVHVPLNKETKNMIGDPELQKIKKGSFILNAARGGVICEKSLLKALNENWIAGAGLDTFENEPEPLKDLVCHPNVIVTPHIGASTQEAQQRIGETVAKQVLKALREEIVDYPVNLPHVSVLGSPFLRMLSVLCEKTALVAAQIFDFHPVQLRLTVNAKIKKEEQEILKLSIMKGFISCASDEFVSYVNAQRLFERRGLGFELECHPNDSTKNEILLEVLGANTTEKVSVGAVLFDSQFARLCSINGFLFEIEPHGDLIVMQNHDRPGVIGDVGSYLAKHRINIAQFELSRNKKGGMAMSLIRTDEGLQFDIIDGLRKLSNLISVRLVNGL